MEIGNPTTNLQQYPLNLLSVYHVLFLFPCLVCVLLLCFLPAIIFQFCISPQVFSLDYPVFIDFSFQYKLWRQKPIVYKAWLSWGQRAWSGQCSNQEGRHYSLGKQGPQFSSNPLRGRERVFRDDFKKHHESYKKCAGSHPMNCIVTEDLGLILFPKKELTQIKFVSTNLNQVIRIGFGLCAQ